MRAIIKAGVIGFPIAHSLSPKLHNYWLKKYGINGEYKAYDVSPAMLGNFVRTMAEKGFSGCNVTIPHKQAVMGFLDQVNDLARAIGAVNTVVARDGKLIGKNTDAYGFMENIRPMLPGKNKAVVLGGGGAAKAVWNTLIGEGFREIIVTNRTAEKITVAPGGYYRAAAWEDRAKILEGVDLLVNATSLGMTGKDALGIDLTLLPRHALVNDIVYTPLVTPLLAAAKERGNPVVDGLGMLLHQAAPAFKEWFGLNYMPEVTNELRQFILAA